VNNICVIVPLRSSEAPILLEQTVGRGLRLMWREPEFQDIKAENRRKLLQEKRKPDNYLDLLSIVEHPAFDQFYQELQKDGVIVEDDREKRKREDTVGDIEIIPLKKDYEKYDLFWPRIVAEAEETLDLSRLKLDELASYKARPLEELLKVHAQPGEKFASEEIIVKTRFGQYTVDMNLFNVQTFKEYLQHVTETVTTRFEATHSRSQRLMPIIQVETAQIMQFISDYIRYQLFGQEFLPYKAYQWKVLLVPEITNHIILELSSAIFKLQENPLREPGKIEKLHFSIAGEWRMRLSNAVVVKKAIYEKLPFSANRGGLEKEFMLYVDSDGEVVRFMRIDNYMHPFASVHYMRHDGLLSNYYPDFIVESEKHIYIVETKAAANMQDENVQRKKMAAYDFVEKLNQTKDEKAKAWHYAILSDNHFAAYKANGASIDEMLLPLILTSESTHAASEGKLF
jgi:type III restriction enzyme